MPLNVINKVSGVQNIFILMAIFLVIALLYAANYKNKLREASICLCYIVNIFLFPSMFFVGGGIRSGMASWFSLGLVMSAMLLEKMDLFFMMLTSGTMIVVCYLVQLYMPQLVIYLEAETGYYADVIFAIFFAIAFTAFIIKYEEKVNARIFQQTMDANDELVRLAVENQSARAAAQSASEAKSSFLSTISQDIRSPLTNIVGMNEMILRETSDDKVEEYALDIRNSSRVIMSIIDEAMDLSRIEQGSMNLELDDYNFVDMIHDIITDAKAKAQDKKLDFVVDIDKNIPLVLKGDDMRLRQVLNNITSNAVKYTNEGVIRFIVFARPSGEENAVDVTFRVRDTGIGIKKQDLEALYESLDKFEVGSNESNGIGLPISQNILKLMGSKIEVESTYGKGSTFSFTVRQEVINTESVGNFDDRLEDMSLGYRKSNSFIAPEAKILVVDDNAMNRKVFGSLLREIEVQIVEATSGYEAIELVRQEHFDMIFLDHMMPAMDGVETLEKMQALEDNQSAGTPVIALTANAITGAKEMYIELGFEDYLSKPVSPEYLVHIIRTHLPKNLLKDAPKEKSKKSKIKTEIKTITLPDVEGIDWNYALTHFPGEDMVLETAIGYYRTLDAEIAALMDLVSDLEQYRIRVHGVKSTSNTIGATAIGGLAKVLEFAARDNNAERVSLLTPILIEELKALKGRMKVLLPKEPEKDIFTDMNALSEKLVALKNHIIHMEQDDMDEVMADINSHSYVERMQVIITQLDDNVMNLEDDAAIANIDELLDIVNSGE